ncbi:hypothetical protein D3C76_1373050 [compost metagenome]
MAFFLIPIVEKNSVNGSVITLLPSKGGIGIKFIINNTKLIIITSFNITDFTLSISSVNSRVKLVL